MIRPGLVQNWPQPRLIEAVSASAICPPRTFNASGSRITGLMLDISANTGIGCGRAAARSNKARPPFSEPVNPTALMPSALTNA
ncbi:hypothetical protein D3C87_1750230 [compost metagenome]